MGSSVSTYVGPTVKSVGKYMRPDNRQACINERCSKHNVNTTDKFCPKCGQETQEIIVAVETEIDLCDILYDIGCDEDFLTKNEYTSQYFPDYDGDYGKYLDPDDSESLSLKDVDIRHELLNFTSNETMVKLFRECLKRNITIEVDYEVVTYWS